MAMVYELTFFLGLGLLAIVVAIYVLSVTQIGKSAELSSEKQHNRIVERKNLATKQIERLQKQLDEAKEIGQIDEAKLRNALAESQAEIEIYETGITRLRERTLLLERKGAIVWPGSSFLATIVFSVAAIATIGINSIIPLALWIFGIFSLTLGIYRVYLTLGALQEVTIASRDSIDRLPEAVKKALTDIELERKPELGLSFLGEQPPFHFKSGQQSIVILKISLDKGDVARNICTFLACPPGFKFPNNPLCAPPSPKPYNDYNCILWEHDSITAGVFVRIAVPIQAPDTPGDYDAIYMMSCEGFHTDWIPIEIIVE